MSIFRKRQVKKPISGTLTSPKTGQTITSTGNKSLDALFGGGLPIGSICLIEEDKYVTYSKVLAKYFLAEGILSRHACFLGSLDDDPHELLRKLPKAVLPKDAAKENTESVEEVEPNGLRIAWRYEELPMVNSEKKNLQIGHNFNLMEHMDELLLHFAKTVVWDDKTEDDSCQDDDKDQSFSLFKKSETEVSPNEDASTKDESGETLENTATEDSEMDVKDKSQKTEQNIFHNPKYIKILRKLQSLLRFKEGKNGQKFLSRVCITSLGSPLWYDSDFAKDILKFLTILKSMIRNTVSVCVLTMPLHIISKIDNTLIPKIRNLVDYAVELESFAGSEKETNHAYKEYNGLFQLRKISPLNTLSVYLPETTDLAFKLRRKAFVIEKIHLPPELDENPDANKTKSAGLFAQSNCGSGSPASPMRELDF